MTTSKRVTAEQANVFRAELREGYSLEGVAQRHGVSAATVKRHAAFDLDGRKLLLGTEVHIQGQRGRWAFIGDVGASRDGAQYATFAHVRSGRTRIFHTSRITRVHHS